MCWQLIGEEIKKNYVVKVGGIKIGELSWQIGITDNNYSTKINLRSKGLLSAIYSFKGEYFSEGTNFENQLISKKYKLAEAKQAHIDLEARKLTGPAILIP